MWVVLNIFDAEARRSIVLHMMNALYLAVGSVGCTYQDRDRQAFVGAL
jgi:hypothetical protein